jgi:hypothetical protein
MTRFAWIVCLLIGHRGVMETNGRRTYLRCERCDRVSPGWER